MDVSIDSRTIKHGQIFIPIKGKTFDGRKFIQEALDKGARVLDVDFWSFAKKYRKKLKCHIIAVTGSAGKTTVKDMLYAVLKQKYNTIKTQENENNEVGAPLTLLRADAETEIAIIEMGARNKGDLTFLAKIIRPTHVVITSIGKTHIEHFKTQRGIACAKAEVFRSALEWESKPRMAFLNFNSPYYELLKQKAARAKYEVYPFGGEDKLTQNMQACHLIGRYFGLTDDEIRQGLRQFSPSKHRMHKIQVKNITLIDDTYNANPDGVQYALEYLKKVQGRKILVIGDMLELGTHTKKEHQKISSWALNAGVDVIFAFGKETAIIKSKYIPIRHFSDKQPLNTELLQELKSGDTILIKGSRGMKLEETVKFVEAHYV